MAILTNGENFGEHGVSQKELINRLAHYEAALHAISIKLDTDSGTGSSDYAADLDQIILSGAFPVMENVTLASIIAEYDA